MDNIVYLSIIAINIIIYMPTIFYKYVCDDLVVQTKQGPRPKKLLTTILLNIRGSRHDDSVLAHIITLISHTICCILIYIAFGSSTVSFLTAVLFAVNPINSECSIWLSGRHYIFNAILVLIMFIIPYSAIAILPFLIFMYITSIRNKLNSPDLTCEEKTLRPRKLILLFKTYGYYFWSCFFPVKIGFYHNAVTKIGITKNYNEQVYNLDKHFYLGVLAVYLVITNMIFNWNPAIRGLVWFSICILPFCNLFTISQPIGFRYSYYANIGLMYFLAMNIINYPWAIGVFLGAYIMKLWTYMPAYKDDFWQAEYNIVERPEVARNWENRGRKRFKAGEYKGALHDYCEAYEKCPHDCKVNYNVASMFMVQGQIDDAEIHLNQAEDNIYQNANGTTQRAMIKEMREQIAKARKTGQVELRKVVVMK